MAFRNDLLISWTHSTPKHWRTAQNHYYHSWRAIIQIPSSTTMSLLNSELKPFRFLALPFEVRSICYMYMIIGERDNLQQQDRHNTAIYYPWFYGPSLPSNLHLSKQFAAEAHKVFTQQAGVRIYGQFTSIPQYSDALANDTAVLKELKVLFLDSLHVTLVQETPGQWNARNLASYMLHLKELVPRLKSVIITPRLSFCIDHPRGRQHPWDHWRNEQFTVVEPGDSVIDTLADGLAPLVRNVDYFAIEPCRLHRQSSDFEFHPLGWCDVSREPVRWSPRRVLMLQGEEIEMGMGHRYTRCEPHDYELIADAVDARLRKSAACGWTD